MKENDTARTPLKNLLRAFFLILLVGCLPTQISEACGPYDYSFHGYSFINTQVVRHDATTTEHFLKFNQFYDYFKKEETQKRNANLAEWQDRFCGLVKLKDLEFVIYKASINDLQVLKTAAQSKSMPMPLRLQGNTMAAYLMNQKCTETIDYLCFAKSCEPYVLPVDGWGGVGHDEDAMRKLIARGKREFRQTKSPYMRLRYAYQIIRLAHYIGDFERAIDLYDDLMPKVDRQVSRMEESIIPYWIMGHRAGAMRALGQHVEASYLYSLIFENCPSRRESAFLSFLIKTDEEWEKCQRLCENDHQRATLHALRANAADSKALEEMKQIYELDPTHDHLEILLVKEIQKMEKNLLGLEFNDKRQQNQRRFGIPKTYAGDYVISLQAFARKCREEGKVARPNLWYIAEGYLQFLAGDYYQANLTFEIVEDFVTDKSLQEQLAAFRLALKISAYKKVTKKVEKEVYEILKDDSLFRKYPDFPDLVRDKMTSLYEKKGRKGKAFLCQHPLKDLKPNPKEELIRDLLFVLNDPDRTQFERILTEDSKGNSIANQLWDLKAVMLMQEYQWEAALEAFKEIPREVWDDYGVFMPFVETLNDCVHCLYRRDTSAMFNRGEVLEELLDLEYKARGELEQNARYFYRIGIGLYNMSFFGHAWKSMDHFRTGSTWSRLTKDKNGVFSYWAFPFGNKDHLDVSRALYYFEKARLLAYENPEFAAKISFMAAKCEQKMYFMSADYQPESCCNRIPNLPEQYLQNFNKLKTDYAETDFYERAVKECKYFRAYVLR